MPFVPSSRSPKKKRNSDSSLSTTDSILNATEDETIPSSVSMLKNEINLSDSQSTLIPENNQNDSTNTINDFPSNSNSNTDLNAHKEFSNPFHKSYTLLQPASSSPPPANSNSMSHITSNRRKFSLDTSDYEDDIPLSISFLRKPSRSNSVEYSRNEKQLMQQNTLLNSKNLSMIDDTIIPNSPSYDNSYFPINRNGTTNDTDDNNNKQNDGETETYIPSPVYSNDTFGSPQSSIRRESIDSNLIPSNFHPLVRKKSGELVKSSLKLNSVFNSSKSLPTTPTYKQVHFGVNIDVKYFDEKDKPTAISASNSPINTDDEDDDGGYFDAGGSGANDDEDDDAEDDYERNHPNDIYYIASDYMESKNVFAYNRFKNLVNRWNLDLGSLPKISYRDHIDQESPVFLERIFISVDKMKLIGQIATKNISFEKKIKVIYTLNNWKAFETIDATYLPDVPRILKKSNYDRFSFEISVMDLFSQYLEYNNKDHSNEEFHTSNAVPLKVSFCVQYLANGQEFWDNNSTLNYNFNFTKILPENYLKTSGPPIKQSRHYLRRTRSHDDQLDNFKTGTNEKPSSTAAKPTSTAPISSSETSISNVIIPHTTPSAIATETTPDSFVTPSNLEPVATNKLLMTPSKNYDNMFESVSKNNSFIFNSKNFNFGSPGTPKLQIHNGDSFLTSPLFNDLNDSSNFKVSAEPQKDDNFSNHNHKRSGLMTDLGDIQPLPLKSTDDSNLFISGRQKMLLGHHPSYTHPNFVNTRHGSTTIPEPPVSSIMSMAATNKLSSPPSSSSPMLPTEDEVYPIPLSPTDDGLSVQTKIGNDNRYTSGHHPSSSASLLMDSSQSSDRISSSKSLPTVQSSAQSGIGRSSQRPDMNSKSYQNIIDQYCFFKSPSTVSTFLRNDINENSTHENTTFH